jgi:hypothetical protein
MCLYVVAIGSVAVTIFWSRQLVHETILNSSELLDIVERHVELDVL